MKAGLAFCITIAVFAAVQAVPLRKSWYDLLPDISLEENNVGDIWKDCSKPGDSLKINSVTITPDPPVKGQKLTVKANITLSEEVTGGEVKVSVKYGIIPVFSKTFNLCDEAKMIGLTCPLKPMMYPDGSLSVDIPSAIPGGHYTGNIEATDQNGKELACIDLDLHF